MGGPFHEVRIPSRRRVGTSGTETFEAGTVILQVQAYNNNSANATVQMPKGDGQNTVSVTVVGASSFNYQTINGAFQMQGTGAQLQIVFTGTVSYFIEYLPPPYGE
jgi:hypothetical protein